MKNHLLSFCLLLFGVIALSSCVQGDMFDEMYEFGDLNSVICRKKGAKDTSSSSTPDYYSNHSSVKYFLIASNLFDNTSCAVDCLRQITGWSSRDITKKFKEIEEGKEIDNNGKKKRNKIGYDAGDIAKVVEVMGGYTCEQIKTSDLRIGDIAITNSPLNLVIDDYGTARSLSSSTGHAFIVEEIFFTNGRNCYKDSSPYCAFDKEYIQGGYRITPN